jgi:hypothetical protein
MRPSSEGTTTSTISFGVSGPAIKRVLPLFQVLFRLLP